MKISIQKLFALFFLMTQVLQAQTINDQLKAHYREDVSFDKLDEQGRLVLVKRLGEFDLFDLSEMRVLTTVKIPHTYSVKGSEDGRYLAALTLGYFEKKYDSKISVYDLTKKYTEYDPEPLVSFYDNIGTDKNKYMKFFNENLLVAGTNRILVFDIQKKEKIKEIDKFSGITSVAYLSKSKKLDVYYKDGLTTLDLKEILPENSLSSTGTRSDLNAKSRIDFLLNLAGLKKEWFRTESIEILKNPNYQYTYSDELFDYLCSFDTTTAKITFAKGLRENEIELNESIGKIKYVKRLIRKSSVKQNQYTEISILNSKFDRSVKLFFQDFHTEGNLILNTNKGFIHEVKNLDPMPNPTERTFSAYRLSNGKILIKLKCGYEALTSQLYRNIGYKGANSISQGVETRHLTLLLTLDESGNTINSRAVYLFPENYQVCLGLDGGFAIVAEDTFKPTLVQHISIDALKEFSDKKNGISVSFFDSNLVLKKFELVDKKRDERIKDSRLLSATSNEKKLVVLFASNQTGTLNEETLTANVYDFKDFSHQQFVNEQSLKIEPYFLVNSTFLDGDVAYFVKAQPVAGGEYEYTGYKIDLSKSFFQLDQVPIIYFKVKP